VSLRTRIAAVAGLAVAVAVLLAAVVVYVAVRSDLRGQIDASLRQRAAGFVASPPAANPGVAGTDDRGSAASGGDADGLALGPSGGAPTAPAGGGRRGAPKETAAPTPIPAPGGPGNGPNGPAPRWPNTVAPARFGAPSGYVQFIDPTGAVHVPGGQGSSPTIAPEGAERAIAARGRGQLLADRTVRGTPLRVLTLGTGTRGAVLVALPLSQVDHELHHILLVLVLVGVVGIALAALLGALVARTALTPIARFTRRTEQLTGDPNLTARLEVRGRDELARLAASFNDTLEELERSVAAQRHLIADASHELRTPIASLRANIQVLQDAARLAPEDREALRRDIVDELDELTALVSDVVELARGASGEPATDDVRLDQIVTDAVERTRRRCELRFQVELQPTLVRGTPERINRAVANLLDNARKWSPPDGLVEVELRDGILTVRDHGPGFRDSDLPHVFERFYRAESARRLPGSGLGLAIVRQAAEAHHGYVKAENAPGGGARLRVSFGTPLRVSSAPAV
jgi:two-component system, OmpR family, sensor histidine kinase MprB